MSILSKTPRREKSLAEILSILSTARREARAEGGRLRIDDGSEPTHRNPRCQTQFPIRHAVAPDLGLRPPGRTGPVSVRLLPGERVEWTWGQLPDGTRQITGYQIVRRRCATAGQF